MISILWFDLLDFKPFFMESRDRYIEGKAIKCLQLGKNLSLLETSLGQCLFTLFKGGYPFYTGVKFKELFLGSLIA